MITIGNNQLYCGDCLEVMKQLPDKSVDLILTDPPYEINCHGGAAIGSRLGLRANKMRDDLRFISTGFDYETNFEQWKRICYPLNAYIFCSNKQITRIMSYFEKDYSTTLLVWNKTNAVPLGNGTYHNNLEFIICVREKGSFFNNDQPIEKKTKIYEMPYPANVNRVHPAQKPVELIQELINMKSKEGQTVLDTFMGSGTTGVACEKMNRKFIGIEIEQKYFDIAVQRIKAENDQMKFNFEEEK